MRLEAAAIVPKAVERSLVQGIGEALPLPDKPSIAVLAFTNVSGDFEQEYFSDGIADDIITELSRSRSLFVIARNSSFTYKGLPVDVKQVAREMGVRYVLEGSVRRSSGLFHVIAQLIDAGTGNQSGRNASIGRRKTYSPCRMRSRRRLSPLSFRRLPMRSSGEPFASRQKAWMFGQRICVACGMRGREVQPTMSAPSNSSGEPWNSMPPSRRRIRLWPRHTSTMGQSMQHCRSQTRRNCQRTGWKRRSPLISKTRIHRVQWPYAAMGRRRS